MGTRRFDAKAQVSRVRALVCGSRHWTDAALIYDVLDAKCPDVVIHGDARGADTIAGRWARERRAEEIRFPADWKTHPKGAGPIRNRRMLREGKPDIVYAFSDDLAASKGTANMVAQARRAGVPVTLYDASGLGVHR